MSSIEDIFVVDPSSLGYTKNYQSYLEYLYGKYHDELIDVCGHIIEKQVEMLSAGYSTDFSDRESELLYMLIRELRPEVTVEISPCHGYSTNYILAALDKNDCGVLHSYEIVTSVKGVSIHDVIYGNICDKWGTERLTLHVGDVTKGSVEDADFLFMDSNHEMWFSAWYFSTLVTIPKYVFVHDIVISASQRDKLLIPKAYSMGIREQYYVLEALKLNSQKFYSTALANFSDILLSDDIPARHSIPNSDRSVFFQGHVQSEDAVIMHCAITELHQARLDSLIGDRNSALTTFEKWRYCDVLFVQLLANALLGEMGYKKRFFPKLFNSFEIDKLELSISEIVAFSELFLGSGQFEELVCLNRFVKARFESNIFDLVLHQISDPIPLKLRVKNRLLTLKNKFF